MPLIGLSVGGPISFTASLFLASYGEQGAYGGFWRLFLAGLAASIPVFASGGVVFAPVEVWLTRRPRRIRIRWAIVFRSGVLSIAGIAGAFAAFAIVTWILKAPPPPTLFSVLLVTYTFIGALIGLAYTFYDEYVYQLRVSTELKQEMRVAKEIQKGLFPRQCPQMVGYDIAARCRPARETGGDFYDFIEFDDGRLGMVIADVAGKGVPAALLMADTRSAWRAEARNKHHPAETVRRVNRTLSRDFNSGNFVTLLYAVLDPNTRQLCLASAGHPLPLLRNDTEVKEVQVYGLPLGLQPDATYEEVQVTLSPGDTVLLYTDGVVESLNSSRDVFGFERIMTFVRREGHHAAADLVERTLAAAQAFADQNRQSDDITVMVLKVC
jgi:hypothetical protein